jgi:hypothetical protein
MTLFAFLLPSYHGTMLFKLPVVDHERFHHLNGIRRRELSR